jgi:hypothetical protein
MSDDMRYLGEAYTTGGPILILQHEFLYLWDGDEDYWQAVDQPINHWLQFTVNWKNACDLCIFRQGSDHNFHVYYNHCSFLVLSELFADPGFEVSKHFPPIDRSISEKRFAKLKHFGSQVVICDAALPGSAISIEEPGCICTKVGSGLRSDIYNTVLVDIAAGEWEADALYCKEEHLSFDGVLFRLVR